MSDTEMGDGVGSIEEDDDVQVSWLSDDDGEWTEIHETAFIASNASDADSAESFVIEEADSSEEEDDDDDESDFSLDSFLGPSRGSSEDEDDIDSDDERELELGLARASDAEDSDIEESDTDETSDSEDKVKDQPEELFIDHTIDKDVFIDIVRQIAREFKSDTRFEAAAIVAVQEAAETYLGDMFADAHLIAVSAGRDFLSMYFIPLTCLQTMANPYITVPTDIQIVRRLKGEKAYEAPIKEEPPSYYHKYIMTRRSDF